MKLWELAQKGMHRLAARGWLPGANTLIVGLSG